MNSAVDGVAFSYSTSVLVDMTEDGPGVLIDSLFEFPDTSEVIDSLVVGQPSSLNLQLADGSLVSLADGPSDEITALENIYLVPVLTPTVRVGCNSRRMSGTRARMVPRAHR